jgi:alkyl hydroperoxide reductase subunit AhpF
MTIGSTLIDPCSVGDLRLRSPNPLDGRFQFTLTANSMPTTLEQAMNVNSRTDVFDVIIVGGGPAGLTKDNLRLRSAF